MPVESRDDLVKRLRDLAGETTLKCWEPRHGAWLSGLRDAATRIESDAKRIAELEAERINHIDYSVDLQRIIEDVCHSRPVRIPKTTARYHYDLAVGYRQGAIAVDRALAEERERYQWRTIDSAPRDGTRILAWEGDERGPFMCWWHDDFPRDESCWMDHQDSEPEPTYWKPLDIPDATAIRSGKPDGKE